MLDQNPRDSVSGTASGNALGTAPLSILGEPQLSSMMYCIMCVLSGRKDFGISREGPVDLVEEGEK
jgi:hypothetical protein